MWKLLKKLKPKSQRERIVEFLSQSVDHADLERRMKIVDREYGYFWNA